MTFTQFSALVAGYMGRDESTFVRGGQNVIMQAVNNALLMAQKKRQFEVQKALVYGAVPVTGLALSGFLGAKGGSAVSVKSFLGFYAYADDAQDKCGESVPFAPIHEVQRFQTRHLGATRPFVYLRGDKVFVYPRVAETQELMAEVVLWMAPVTSGSDTNVFLTHHVDWLLLAVVQELNFFLKEDQRVVISAQAMVERWRGVEDWDMSLSVGGSNWTSLE
jgi:hypothetical protein